MTYFQIAWRNLVKQPRKTVVLVLAIGVGLFSLLFFECVINGFYAKMIENAVNGSLGHIQINNREFRLRRDARYLIEKPDNLIKEIKKSHHVKACSKRIICQGLVSSPETSLFASINGIGPNEESLVTTTSSDITQGRPLKDEDTEGILLGRAMAEKLKVGVGDKVVVMIRSIGGEMEGAALRVRGIYKGATGEFEKAHVYITIDKARHMLGVKDGANQIAVRIDDSKNVDGTAAEIKRIVTDPVLSVETWAQLEPLIKQQLDMSASSSFVMFGVIFTALAFGIINSFLMEIFDRIKEFGIMMSLGTKPVNIFFTIMLESILLGLLGVAGGSILSIFILYGALGGQLDFASLAQGLEKFGFASIVPLKITGDAYFRCAGGSLLTVMVAAIYPAMTAASFRPMDAIRHV